MVARCWPRRPSRFVTTVCCAWRWTVVARGLGVRLSLPAAVAAYYRSLFLNLTLPGGVVGDVHRGVSHGRDMQRRRPRRAGRRLGAHGRAGRAGGADDRRPPRAAVARALLDADRGGAVVATAAPSSCSAGLRGERTSRWARVRHTVAADVRAGLLRRKALPGGRARVGRGRPRPCPHVPRRRADGRRHRASLAAAAAGVARAAGHGAAERRRLGAA